MKSSIVMRKPRRHLRDAEGIPYPSIISHSSKKVNKRKRVYHSIEQKIQLEVQNVVFFTTIHQPMGTLCAF